MTTTRTATESAVPPRISDLLRASLASEDLQLPMLPDVAAEILALCESDAVDARRLSDVLHRDQSLAGHVLRISNSTLYQGSVPIVSLQQAISRLGLQTLSEIIVAVAMQGKVFRCRDAGNIMVQLWRHSLAAGYFSKEIARVRRSNVESAFLCGLLHDVGKAIVASILFDRAADELSPNVIHAAMDSFHVDAGARLGEHWQLPQIVRESIRYHHDDYGEAPAHSEAAMQTCLADQLAYLTIPSRLWTVTEEQLRQHAVIEGLNLYTDEFDAVLAHRDAVVERVEAIG